MAKFNVGDAVAREKDVGRPEKGLKFGVVLECYSERSKYFGLYPELYAVRWEDGKEERGFLPHGLMSATAVSHG